MLYGADNQPLPPSAENRRLDARAQERTHLLASLREDRLRRVVEEWRKDAAGRVPVALPPQTTLLTIAYWMYYTSGLYGGIIEKKTSVICGDGFGWTAKDAQVRDAIKGFWRDRVNALSRRIEVLCNELSAFGELFLLQYVQKSTGRLRIGRVMPWNVERVITDPGNPECPIAIKVGNTNDTIPILMGPDTPEYERRNFSARARALRKKFKNAQAADGLRGCLYYCVNPRYTDDGGLDSGPELRGTTALFAGTNLI